VAKVIWQRPNRISRHRGPALRVLDSHLIHVQRSFDPHESSPQTGPGSVQPFVYVKLRERQTDAGIIDHNNPQVMNWTRPILEDEDTRLRQGHRRHNNSIKLVCENDVSSAPEVTKSATFLEPAQVWAIDPSAAWSTSVEQPVTSSAASELTFFELRASLVTENAFVWRHLVSDVRF